MSCQEIREQLNDYVDGELATDVEHRVEEHLAACAGCREDVRQLRSLLEAAGSLAAEIEPERDLWPGVESRIGKPERAVLRGSWASASWVGLAAAAVLVAAVIFQVARRDVEIAPQPVAPTATISERQAEYALVSDEVRVRNGLMQVREDLLRSIGERRDSLDPETQETLARNLTVIDRAITEIQQALEENPDNQGLEFLLAATYQREVEFLKQINMI